MKAFQLRLLLQRNDQWVNNHNGFSLLHWGANTDLQVIVGPYGAAVYCCLYSSSGKLIIGKLSEFIGILTANCCTAILRPFQRCFWS
jgi:hypothetical protein